MVPTRTAPAEAERKAAASTAWGEAQLPDRVFGGFRDLIREEAGIHLHAGKKALVVGRLSGRLRELGLADMAAYLEMVRESAQERTRMVDAICTNETRFFREPAQFEHIAARAVPKWREAADAGKRQRAVRVWSAACSSGEEPFSIAMLLHAALPASEGWRHEILATDLSTKILSRARRAVWPMERSADIPESYLKAFMLRGVGPEEGRFRASAPLRNAVRFESHNLLDPPAEKGFDLIFCRNVLIYFDEPTKRRVLDHLIHALAPGGWLLLGHAESLIGHAPQARSLGPNIYDFPPGGRGAGSP